MVTKVNFSEKEKQHLASVLGDLKAVCHPSIKEIEPFIAIDPSARDLDYEHGYYSIQTLDDLAKTKQMLPPDIHCLSTKGTNWFYTTDEPLNFYSDKAYVHLDFSPQRLHSPNIITKAKLRPYIQKMLTKITAGQTTAVCEQVYALDPPREHILAVLANTAEQVRRVILQHLLNHHAHDIQQLPAFHKFKTGATDPTTILRQFLKEGQRGLLLAQKWGYITNAQRLIHYQQRRDIPRHPSELMPNPILHTDAQMFRSKAESQRWVYHRGYPYQNPTQLYQDFAQALSFIKPTKSKDVSAYADQTCTIWDYQEIEQLKKILQHYRREKKMETFLHNNFPTEISTESVTIEHPDKTKTNEMITHFGSFYVRKKGVAPEQFAQKQQNGSLMLKEEDFHDWITLSNNAAHANEGYKTSIEILSQDFVYIMDFVHQLQQVHDKRQHNIISRAINNSSATII